MSERCLCCGEASPTPLIRFAAVPVSGVYLDDASSHVPRADLALTFCPGCGLASKVPVDGVGLDYVRIDRGTAQQMPDYAAQIMGWMRQVGVADSTTIIEVGSNDGSFLTYLAANGFTSVLGIEPSRTLAATATAKGFVVETGFCTARSAAELVQRTGLVGAVVCRHTLEHVPDPSDLLAAIGTLLVPNGIALIEVPDFDWVIETLAVHEIWDEHISYFTRANISAALRRHGFEVLRCERLHFRDTRNLVVVARWLGAARAHDQQQMQPTPSTVDGCRRLAARWHAMTASLATEVASWPRPVFAAGASHIQSNFIHFAGLASQVDGLIDDDPRKTGKYVMLDAPKPIVSTASILDTMQSGTLLRIAFPYQDWMDRLSSALAPRGVRIVDPYREVRLPVTRSD